YPLGIGRAARGERRAAAENRLGYPRQTNGERGRNRTFNLLIKSQLLCQLSYAPTPSERKGRSYAAQTRKLTAKSQLIRAFAFNSPEIVVAVRHVSDYLRQRG